MNLVRLSLVCFLMTAFVGCGGAPSGPRVFPVSGTVKHKGQPLAGADVSFHKEKAPRAASGRTDSQGKYQLTMFETNDGALPGKNLVTISVPGETTSMEQMMSGKAPPKKSPIPPEYSNNTATPFSYEVKESKNEGVDFDIP